MVTTYSDRQECPKRFFSISGRVIKYGTVACAAMKYISDLCKDCEIKKIEELERRIIRN